ncbi:MAG TPA: FkbM family methyltransferase [Pyrinomonadaceae bacterium]|nr:FkbM family methyltransferase [Pyrinomonadaceae bacterium]
MSANSLSRRMLKRLLYPLLNDTSYKYFQAVAMSWDIRRGAWTEPELELLKFAVKDGDVALDIGANFGLYCYHLAPLVGPTGAVFAFEPVPFTFSTLKLVGRLLGFPKTVKLIPKGCADRDQTISFVVPVQASGAQVSGMAYLTGRNDDRSGKEVQVRWDATKTVTSEAVALDSYLGEPGNLSLIKCDIEGAELLAFRGAKRLIEHYHPTVICEINPWYLEGYGIALAELTGFFFEKGYSLYSYDWEKTGELVLIDDLNNVVEDNYLFIHSQRLDDFSSILN